MSGPGDDLLNWYQGNGERRSETRIRDGEGIGAQPPAALTDPAGYRPSAETRDAVNVALLMGLPLLVSGEPGSGKTQLGFAVAHELGLDAPSIFVTKSTSQARDLLYRYDAIRHFHASQTSRDSSALAFLQLQPLGRAIFDAMPADARLAFGGESLSSAPPKRSLVIVDEIDKAPRDFPNDLLYEVDHLRFRVPELDNYESPPIDDALRPILLITTNAEQLLPDAFLRRCAFLHLEPPRGQELAALIERRFKGRLVVDHPLLRDIVGLSDRLRERAQLERAPSSAELLQFVAALLAGGGRPELGLAEQSIPVDAYLPLLAKSASDAQRLAAEIGK